MYWKKVKSPSPFWIHNKTFVRHYRTKKVYCTKANFNKVIESSNWGLLKPLPYFVEIRLCAIYSSCSMVSYEHTTTYAKGAAAAAASGLCPSSRLGSDIAAQHFPSHLDHQAAIHGGWLWNWGKLLWACTHKSSEEVVAAPATNATAENKETKIITDLLHKWKFPTSERLATSHYLSLWTTNTDVSRKQTFD